MSRKILCVDDDQHILTSLQRLLRKQFEIEVARGPEEALEKLDSAGPYAVVVSDMRMPGMDGSRLLAEVRKKSPDTVRMVLTGDCDMHQAIEAVNQGHIFRFLTKPCPLETMAKALETGLEQYRSQMAQKGRLGKTLGETIKVLTDVLAVANPVALGRAVRVRRLVQEMAKAMGVDDWQPEIAAMLSQLGCIACPAETLDRLYCGRPASRSEMRAFENHPHVGRELLTGIPRLTDVGTIIAYQEKHYDGSGPPEDRVKGDEIPFGARLLKVALDYDALLASGLTPTQARGRLLVRASWYDPAVMEVLETVIRAVTYQPKALLVHEMTSTMLFAEDVVAPTGDVVAVKGQEVTSTLQLHLGPVAAARGNSRFNVLVPTETEVRAAPGGAPRAPARPVDRQS